jgi:hypothetical protein
MDWVSAWPDEAVLTASTQGIVDALGWGVLLSLLFLFPLVVLFSRAIRQRRFWCAQSRREVEVEFEERGLPGFRRAVNVRSCSVFDPPAAVACRRRCLDAGFRRQWEPALPVQGRGGAYAGRRDEG